MNQTCSLSKLDQICLCQLYYACRYNTNHMKHWYICLDSTWILHLPMKILKACSSHSSWALDQVLVSFVWFLIHYPPQSFEWGNSSKVPLNVNNLQSTCMIMLSSIRFFPIFENLKWVQSCMILVSWIHNHKIHDLCQPSSLATKLNEFYWTILTLPAKYND
jgi:hypothetical protein